MNTHKQGRRLTVDEQNEIMRLHEEGMSYSEIGKRIGRSTNTICSFINRKDGMPYPPPQKKNTVWELPEEVDYSQLDDSVLFNPKKFPSF